MSVGVSVGCCNFGCGFGGFSDGVGGGKSRSGDGNFRSGIDKFIMQTGVFSGSQILKGWR